MMEDYFVMLHTQTGGIAPLVEDDGEEICTFESPQEAVEAAEKNILGANFGFEVFCRGDGHEF